MAKLSDKQKRFVDEYIKDLNGKQAAIRAGYSKRTAETQGSRLLSNAKVKAYLQKRMAKHEKKTIADQEEILSFLTKVVRGEITEQVPLLAGDGIQDLAHKDMSAKDRIKAAELLGKRYAMWTDKKELSGNLEVMYIVDDTGDDEEDE